MQFPSSDEQRRMRFRVCGNSGTKDKEWGEVWCEERRGNSLLVNAVACGVPASAVPFSSGAWRMELALGRVPLAWCLKMEEESSSRVQPSR